MSAPSSGTKTFHMIEAVAADRLEVLRMQYKVPLQDDSTAQAQGSDCVAVG